MCEMEAIMHIVIDGTATIYTIQIPKQYNDGDSTKSLAYSNDIKESIVCNISFFCGLVCNISNSDAKEIYVVFTTMNRFAPSHYYATVSNISTQITSPH